MPHRSADAVQDSSLLDLQDLLAVLPLPFLAKAHLLQRMAEPHRRFHGLERLGTLWRHHRALWEQTGLGEACVPAIACALAFRHAVFEIAATDNKERSAELWLEVGRIARLDGTTRGWVADTIVASADPAAAVADGSDPWCYARQWVLDLELSPLGESGDVFDANVALLRAEAPDCADREWEDDFHRACAHFAAMRPLYRSEPVARRFAEPARRNLERHLYRMQAAA